MMNKQYILKKLSLLGLDNKEAEIYLSLLHRGTLSPLELSRRTQINRTTIYRLLESLKEKGLVEEILEQKSKKARAVSPQKLEALIVTKEAMLDELKESLPDIIKTLSTVQETPSTNTTVAYFRGQSGLQQLLWNTLKAAGKSEVLGYGYLNWNKSIGAKFAEKIRAEYVRRRIKSREIQNPESLEKNDYSQVKNYIGQYYQGKFLPKTVLEIKHDTYIYNDVFAFVHFYQEELFGIEIHNPEIAKTQRQIFEILWQMAKTN